MLAFDIVSLEIFRLETFEAFLDMYHSDSRVHTRS